MTVTLHEGSLIVCTLYSCSALDEVTGLTLWHGTVPDDPNFVHRLLTSAYAVAVDVSDQVDGEDSVAFFYDHRNASGVIPSIGGVRNLGKLEDIRALLAVDGGLLVQTGSTILSWTHE